MLSRTVRKRASTPVQAEGQRSTSSPVGSYISAITQIRGSTFYSPLTLKASGAFAFKHGPSGTWTDTNGTVVMDGQLNTAPFVFTVKQVGRNLGSPARKGTATEGGYPFGNWYAVRR